MLLLDIRGVFWISWAFKIFSSDSTNNMKLLVSFIFLPPSRPYLNYKQYLTWQLLDGVNIEKNIPALLQNSKTAVLVECMKSQWFWASKTQEVWTTMSRAFLPVSASLLCEDWDQQFYGLYELSSYWAATRGFTRQMW